MMVDLIFLKGAKRSGNHLIINWLLSHYINPIFKNDINSFEYLNIGYIKTQIKTIKPQAKNDCLLISIETPHLMDDTQTEEIIQYILKNISINNIYKPFVIRDPVNWYMSSLMKRIKTNKLDESEENLKKISEELNASLWDMYRLNINYWTSSNFKIDYNKFIQSINYRMNLSKIINKPFVLEKDNKTLNTLWEPKGVSIGSSFDKEKIRKGLMQAKDMKVLERYKECEYLFEIIKLPKDISNFSHKNWPEIPTCKNNTIKMQ